MTWIAPKDASRLRERVRRITQLMEKPRCMTPRAAATVVDAAMFGIGCTEGEVRDRIQKQKEQEEKR